MRGPGYGGEGGTDANASAPCGRGVVQGAKARPGPASRSPGRGPGRPGRRFHGLVAGILASIGCITSILGADVPSHPSPIVPLLAGRWRQVQGLLPGFSFALPIRSDPRHDAVHRYGVEDL